MLVEILADGGPPALDGRLPFIGDKVKELRSSPTADRRRWSIVGEMDRNHTLVEILADGGPPALVAPPASVWLALAGS